MKKTRLLLVILASQAIFTVSGQKLVTTYQSPLPIRAAYISAILAQPDGKILIGGDIAFYRTERVHNLIRLNDDGSLDETFSYNGADEFMITHLKLLASGEMIALARKLDSYDFLLHNDAKLIKIGGDGSILQEVAVQDHSRVFAVDEDGKIITGYETLMRYNNDLTPDDAFNSNFSANGPVNAAAMTGDKILVAGRFSEVNGMPNNDLVKLNADGTLDNSFNAGTGTDDYIGALTVQPDGKILLGECYINSFNNIQAGGMLRLEADGSIDPGFQPPTLNGGVSKVLVTADGIYAAAFLQINGEAKDRFYRLHISDGNLDANFPPVELDEFGAFSFVVDVANDQLIANNTQAHGNVFGLSKINTSGSYDNTFVPEVSRYGTIRLADIFQGKMLVAGDFIRMNGIETYGVARLTLNGQLDETFRLKDNKGEVHQIKVLDDDNLLVSTYKHFFKLDAVGNEKPDFNWTQFKNLYQIVKFKVLPDGKIMAADANLIYRLNSNGSEDTSFDVTGLCCAASTAFDFDMQGDKVIYGSEFSELGGISVNRLARLDLQGVVDPTFNPGSGPTGTVSLIKVLKNQEIIVGGFFTEMDGKPLTLSLVKLSPDGALDTEFYNNLNENPYMPWDIVFSRKVEQLGSKIYFQHRTGIAAISTDGKVDMNFNIPAVVSAVADIITLTESPGGGRIKTDSAFLFTVGNFKLNGANSPSFVLKMKVNTDISSNPDGPSDITTGLGESAAGRSTFKIEAYPHPAKDNLSFKVSEPAGILHATVVDLSGRKYIDTTVSAPGVNDTGQIELQSIPSGFYILRLTNEKGKTGFAKFVKVR
jgi:uncharacterized delta-60 repeat protein